MCLSCKIVFHRLHCTPTMFLFVVFSFLTVLSLPSTSAEQNLPVDKVCSVMHGANWKVWQMAVKPSAIDFNWTGSRSGGKSSGEKENTLGAGELIQGRAPPAWLQLGHCGSSGHVACHWEVFGTDIEGGQFVSLSPRLPRDSSLEVETQENCELKKCFSIKANVLFHAKS